jgi:RNA polymerase sporulation-specific sigma factor
MNYQFKDLVIKAKAGCQASQMEIMDRLKPLLFSVVKRYAWALDREEMLQEARLAVLEGIREFDEARGIPFLAFIKRKLMFHVYNKARKQRISYSLNTSAGEEETQDFLDLLPDESADPLGDILHKECTSAVQSALDQLDPRQKQVILLHFFQGTSLKSIAEQQSLSYKTILRLKDKALAALKDSLNKYS